MSEEKKLNGTVIVTYRCNARCSILYGRLCAEEHPV